MPLEMTHWVEGLIAAYVVAAAAMGFVFAFGTDLPWIVKLGGAVLWPLTAVLLVWSMWTAARAEG